VECIATKHWGSEALNSIVGGTSDPPTVSNTPHSHSIVSGTCKHLKENAFVSERAKFTVGLTVYRFCLAAIDGDSNSASMAFLYRALYRPKRLILCADGDRAAVRPS
jgi:hypothetical protein